MNRRTKDQNIHQDRGDLSESAHLNEWSHWVDGGHGKKLIAAIAVRPGKITGPSAASDESIANARLISAAPKLLAAAMDAFQTLKNLSDSIDGKDIIDFPTYAEVSMSKLRQAIEAASFIVIET